MHRSEGDSRRDSGIRYLRIVISAAGLIAAVALLAAVPARAQDVAIEADEPCRCAVALAFSAETDDVSNVLRAGSCKQESAPCEDAIVAASAASSAAIPAARSLLDRLEPLLLFLVAIGITYYAAYWIGPFLSLMELSKWSEIGLVLSGAAIELALLSLFRAGGGATAVTVVALAALAFWQFAVRTRENHRTGRCPANRFGWLLLGAMALAALLGGGRTLTNLLDGAGWATNLGPYFGEILGWLAVIVALATVLGLFSMAAHGDTPRLTIETWSDKDASQEFGKAVLAEIRFLASDETSGLQVSKPESTIAVPKAALSVSGAGGALASLADAFRPRRSYTLHIDSIEGSGSRLGVLGTLRRGWVLVASEQIRSNRIGYTPAMVKSNGVAPDPTDLAVDVSSVTAAAVATWTLQQIQSEMGDTTAIYGTSDPECAELTSAGARWSQLGYSDTAVAVYTRAIGLDASDPHGSFGNKTARNNVGVELMSDSGMNNDEGDARPALLEYRGDVAQAWTYFKVAFGGSAPAGVDLPLHLRALYNLAAAALNMWSVEIVLKEHTQGRQFTRHTEMFEYVVEHLAPIGSYEDVKMTVDEREFVNEAAQMLRLVRQNIESALNKPITGPVFPPADERTPFANHIIACRLARNHATFEQALDYLEMAAVRPRFLALARADLCYYALRSDPGCAARFDEVTLPTGDGLGSIAIISSSEEVRAGFEDQGFTEWRQLVSLAGDMEAQGSISSEAKINPVLVRGAVDAAVLADQFVQVMRDDLPGTLSVPVANLFQAAGYSDSTDFARVRRTSTVQMRKDLMRANRSGISSISSVVPLDGSGRYVTWSVVGSSLDWWIDAAARIR